MHLYLLKIFTSCNLSLKFKQFPNHPLFLLFKMQISPKRPFRTLSSEIEPHSIHSTRSIQIQLFVSQILQRIIESVEPIERQRQVGHRECHYSIKYPKETSPCLRSPETSNKIEPVRFIRLTPFDLQQLASQYTTPPSRTNRMRYFYHQQF